MKKSHLHIDKCRVYLESFLGFTLLLCGCVIYLLFRSKSLYIYKWCSALGLSEVIDNYRYAVRDWNIPYIVRFSLPDGLYCAAYILIIDAIWHNNAGIVKYLILSLVPLVTISSEILQYFGLVKGTFDVNDLICYLIPPIIYLIFVCNSVKLNN